MSKPKWRMLKFFLTERSFGTSLHLNRNQSWFSNELEHTNIRTQAS